MGSCDGKREREKREREHRTESLKESCARERETRRRREEEEKKKRRRGWWCQLERLSAQSLGRPSRRRQGEEEEMRRRRRGKTKWRNSRRALSSKSRRSRAWSAR